MNERNMSVTSHTLKQPLQSFAWSRHCRNYHSTHKTKLKLTNARGWLTKLIIWNESKPCGKTTFCQVKRHIRGANSSRGRHLPIIQLVNGQCCPFAFARQYFITHDAVPNIVGLKAPTETLCESDTNFPFKIHLKHTFKIKVTSRLQLCC